jgi:cephalosporin hydroxylase
MLKIDFDRGIVETSSTDGTQAYPIGSPEAFRLISRAWLRSGWDAKYVYGFSWMGRPIIQLPEDLLRIQEVLYRLKPDVVIETGIADGGCLVFSDRITMIEGSSISEAVVAEVRRHVRPGERGLVLLDSNHTRAHVLAELRAYAQFTSVGSYIVACDGIMQEIVGAPRTKPEWLTDNPQSAVKDFLSERDDFVLTEPVPPFNEGQITQRVTYWPNAFLQRTR